MRVCLHVWDSSSCAPAFISVSDNMSQSSAPISVLPVAVLGLPTLLLTSRASCCSLASSSLSCNTLLSTLLVQRRLSSQLNSETSPCTTKWTKDMGLHRLQNILCCYNNRYMRIISGRTSHRKSTKESSMWEALAVVRPSLVASWCSSHPSSARELSVGSTSSSILILSATGETDGIRLLLRPLSRTFF